MTSHDGPKKHPKFTPCLAPVPSKTRPSSYLAFHNGPKIDIARCPKIAPKNCSLFRSQLRVPVPILGGGHFTKIQKVTKFALKKSSLPRVDVSEAVHFRHFGHRHDFGHPKTQIPPALAKKIVHFNGTGEDTGWRQTRGPRRIRSGLNLTRDHHYRSAHPAAPDLYYGGGYDETQDHDPRGLCQRR